MEKDPEELIDRSADPAYQEVKKELLALLSRQQLATE